MSTFVLAIEIQKGKLQDLIVKESIHSIKLASDFVKKHKLPRDNITKISLQIEKCREVINKY